MKENNILETETSSVYNVLSYEEIKKINWAIADTLRDKSGLGEAQYMFVGLPLIALKRFLDTRNEFIKKHVLIEGNPSYDMNITDGKLEVFEAHLEDNENDFGSQYNTNTPQWFGVTWKDLINFEEIDTNSGRDVQLNEYEITIHTKAKTKKEFLEEILESLSSDQLLDVIKEFDFVNLINDKRKINDSTFTELINILNGMDLTFENASEDVFSDAFIDLIDRFSSDGGSDSGEFFTPHALTKELVKLLSPVLPKFGKFVVADVAAGSGTFLLSVAHYFEIHIQDLINNKDTESLKEKYPELYKKIENIGIENIKHDDIISFLNNKIEFVAQEKNPISKALGVLNIVNRGYSSENYLLANSITEFKDNIGRFSGKVNLSIGNPPYGLKDYGIDFAKANEESDSRFKKYGIPKKGEGEYAFIITFLNLIESVNESNEETIFKKAGVLLPLGTLFKDSTKSFRKKFVEEDIVEGLVTLPGNMFKTTGIPTVFWIFNLNKPEEDKNKIFMMNHSEIFTKFEKYNRWDMVDEKDRIGVYNNREEREGTSGYVSYEDIIENDYNFSVQRYIFKDEPEEVIDIVALTQEITELDAELAKDKKEMNSILSQVIKLQEKK